MEDNSSKTQTAADTSANPRFNILFLTKWYPNKFDPQLGVFIQKHAKAVSNYCNVTVLYACPDENLNTTYKMLISIKKGYTEIIVYYKRNTSPLKKFINARRYFKANEMAIVEVVKSLGNIDLVHVNVLNRPGLIARYSQQLKGIPYIVSEHWTGYASGKYKLRSERKKRFAKHIISKASAITTVSKGLKEKMISFGLINDYYVIPNVIETIAPPLPANNSKTKILTVADLLDSQKNISGILKAIANIVKQNKNIEYHIIGDGPDRTMLSALADSLLINNKFVFFHGRKDNEFVYEFMKQIDFVIINSNYETFSVVAAEALVNGKPVIATLSGGPEDFITDEYGMLIEKGNQQQLEEAIVKMISTFKTYNPNKLNTYISEKFNYNTIGKQFYAIYKTVLEKTSL